MNMTGAAEDRMREEQVDESKGKLLKDFACQPPKRWSSNASGLDGQVDESKGKLLKDFACQPPKRCSSKASGHDESQGKLLMDFPRQPPKRCSSMDPAPRPSTPPSKRSCPTRTKSSDAVSSPRSSLVNLMEAAKAAVERIRGEEEEVEEKPSEEFNARAPLRRYKSMEPMPRPAPAPSDRRGTPLKRSNSSIDITTNVYRRSQLMMERQPRRGRRKDSARVTDDDRLQRIVDSVSLERDAVKNLLDQDGQLDAIKAYFKKGGAVTNSACKEGIHFYMMTQMANNAA